MVEIARIESVCAESERAKRLMAMGQMAALLAHEIRNPLGSMELYCSLLQKDLVDKPELRSMAENIHAGIRTLDRIISNCLQFARDIEPRVQHVDNVSGLLSECIEYAKARDETKKVDFKLDTLGSGVVCIDPYLIKQVFANIIVNAMEAASHRWIASNYKGNLPQVTIVSDLSKVDFWSVFVSDNGNGIAKDIRESVFDPFFSTKQTGTGLGLAVVHSIVSAHKGNVFIGDTFDYSEVSYSEIDSSEVNNREVNCGAKVTVVLSRGVSVL